MSENKGNRWLVCATIVAGLAVILGAFGAHGLKDWLGEQFPDDFEKRLANWETGARYQMYHALGLMAYTIAAGTGRVKTGAAVPILFLLGVLFFSGSLYLLATTQLRFMGAVAPLGGSCWILGWGWFAWLALQGPLPQE